MAECIHCPHSGDSTCELLRPKVPERWRVLTSPVAAAQIYISELEDTLRALISALDHDIDEGVLDALDDARKVLRITKNG